MPDRRRPPLGAAHAHRRTFSSGILPSAHSMLSPLRLSVFAPSPPSRRRFRLTVVVQSTTLRLPGFAWRHTPAPGHGQPLAKSSTAFHFHPGSRGRRRSTSVEDFARWSGDLAGRVTRNIPAKEASAAPGGARTPHLRDGVSRVEIEAKLVRVRPQPHRIDLLLPLPFQPRCDHVVGEHVAAEEEIRIFLQGVEGLVE